MKNIITIQHTQSIHHTNGMIGGQGDWNLSELGIEQAKQIGKNLSKEIDGSSYIMYSSDLLRAKQTAENVGEYLGIKPILTAALREISCGEANGISKDEAQKIFIGPMKTVDDISYPNAESMRDVWNRLSVFLDDLLANKAENIIIVAHGISLGIFNLLWLDLSVESLNKCVCGALLEAYPLCVKNHQGLESNGSYLVLTIARIVDYKQKDHLFRIYSFFPADH